MPLSHSEKFFETARFRDTRKRPVLITPHKSPTSRASALDYGDAVDKDSPDTERYVAF